MSRTALSAALALALAPAAFAAEVTKPIDRTFTAVPGGSLSLLNLAGNVTVVKSAGPDIRVAATVHAEGASQAEAERLADLLELVVDESGSKISVKAKYPLDTHRKYSYPRRADVENLPWFLEWLDLGGSSSTYDGVKVRVNSQRSAPVLFADFRIEAPEGVEVSVREMIGELRAEGVAGDVRLELGSGMIQTRDGIGALSAESGSGDIEVVAQNGRVRCETGSGDVRLERVTGESVAVETGSGDVRLERVTGESVAIETGSGDVHLLFIAAALSADTGSGDIVADGVTAGATLLANTGSGDVRISGDLSAVTRLDIDTGSGDVTLSTDPAPELRLAVSTGSGGITLDMPASRVTRNGDDDVRIEIGAATGTGSISTGSGDVVLRSRG